MNDVLEPDDEIECRTCRPPRTIRVRALEAHVLMLHGSAPTIWENTQRAPSPECYAIIWADRDPLDPHEAICGRERDGYRCTRAPHDGGRHVATGDPDQRSVVAAWPGERRLEPGDLG